MENMNSEQEDAQLPPYPPHLPSPQPAAGAPFSHHLIEQQQQQSLQMFWSYQRQQIEQDDFKNHQFPLTRIMEIMKANEDVRWISAEATILLSKACELFILELTIRSWPHAAENKRRELQKNNIAVARTALFRSLVYKVPRDELNDEVELGMVGPATTSPVPYYYPPAQAGVDVGPGTTSGLPYYYPPMGQSATGMMMGQPAVNPAETGAYVEQPSQAWQSVWPTAAADDGFYASGGSSGQSNLDGQRYYAPVEHQATGMMVEQPVLDSAAAGVYVGPPSQAWQTVWPTAAADDGSYASGGSSGQGNLEGQRTQKGGNNPIGTMDPDSVAMVFLEHYYSTFDTNRAGLANLYQESSMLTFDGKKIEGSPSIVAKLTSLPYQQFQRNITTVDCQPSGPAGGILVVVSGNFQLSGEEQNALEFSEMFHLMPTPQGSFYVLNDIFRLNHE